LYLSVDLSTTLADNCSLYLSDVLVEENIAGLTESDESDDEFDDVLYSLIDGEEED